MQAEDTPATTSTTATVPRAPRWLPPRTRALTRPLVLASASTVFLALTPSTSHAGAENATKPGSPNIVFILADDLGWSDLGREGDTTRGSDYYETPHINRLARAGLSFDSCYVQPNCAPTRAALLSGQYAPRSGNGVYNVGSLDRGTRKGSFPLAPPPQSQDVPASTTTVAEALKAAGYVTAHFGKFHVGGHGGGDATLPGAQGFDHSVAGGPQGHPAGYFALRDDATGRWAFRGPEGSGLETFAKPYSEEYVQRHSLPSSLVGTPKHLTDAIGDAVVAFIDQHREPGSDTGAPTRPFYIQVHPYAVHTPIQPRPDLEEKFAAKPPGERHRNPRYAALLAGLDQTVGRIDRHLQDTGLARNTVVVFTSDNGGHMGPTDNHPLRGRKGEFYDGGIRVPLIVRFPGVTPPGSRTDTLVHAVDFYPTLLALAKAPAPDPAAQPLDGVAFDKHLANPDSWRDRPPAFYHFPGYLDTRAAPCSVVIKDHLGYRFKLIHHYADSRNELYNLSDDPGEQRDLMAGGYWEALTHNGVANDLAAELSAWLGQEHPTWSPSYPADKGSGQPVAPPAPTVEPPQPRDDQPAFAVLGEPEPVGANEVRLTWVSSPGFTFNVEGSLDGQQWMNLAGPVVAEGDETTMTVGDPFLLPGFKRLYRVTVAAAGPPDAGHE